MSIHVSVIIPVYNEKETIGDCVEKMRKKLSERDDVEIIIVNDGSDDASPEYYENIADRLINHSERCGYGAALKTGFRHAKGNIIAIADGDGTYPVERLPELIEIVEQGADMAVGKRKLLPDEIRSFSPAKILRATAKWILRRVANYLAGQRIPDLNSGMRAFRRETMEHYIKLFPDGFSLTTTLTLAYLCNGLNVQYVPIDYADRPRGQLSKIRPIRDTWQIFLTIIRTVLFFNPLKVCIPLALILWTAGFITLIGSWLYAERIMDGTITVCVLSGVQVLMIGLLAEVIVKKD